MFLEWVNNSLYQQRFFVFCVVLFSIYTDIYIDFVIDLAFCIVIHVMLLYHDVLFVWTQVVNKLLLPVLNQYSSKLPTT